MLNFLIANKKIALLILAVLVAAILIYFWLNKKPKIDTHSLQNANQIGIDLGVEYSGFNPQSWTENDDAVKELILSIPEQDIDQLIKDYKKIFSRDLVNDLQTKLDDWEEVKYKFTESKLKNPIKKASAKIKKSL